MTSLAHAGPPVLEPLFPRASLHGVHGLVFDEAGQLYAAETWGLALHKVDPTSGSSYTIVPPPDGASDDVGIIAPELPHGGTLIWSANLEGKVMARDPDGHLRVLAEGLPGINSIVISREGRILATQTGPVNRLLDIDPSGRSAPQVLLADSGGLNGFAITADGTIYGPQQQAALNRIVRIDPSRTTIDVISTGLVWPTGVKQAADGTLYGVDLGSGVVFRLDPATGIRTSIAQFEPGLDNLAISPGGHVFVSHIPTSSIFDIDPKNSQVRTVVRGHFGVPGGIACISEGKSDTLYVADLFTLKRVDAASRVIRTLVPLDRQSTFPSNVGVRGDHLITSSFLSGIVAVYDRASGALLRKIPGFRSPRSALELGDGRLIVAEAGSRSLVLVDANGQRTPVPGLTEEFAGLAQSADGRILATAPDRGALFRIDPFTARYEVVAEGLGAPDGIAIGERGAVLVLDRAAGVLRAVDPRSGAVRIVRKQIPVGLGSPPELIAARLFHGLAAGDCSAPYVASDRDGTIYRVASAAGAKRRAANAPQL